MIPKVISLKKSGPTRGHFSEVISYIGRDGQDAKDKGLAPLDASACGVINIEADVDTPEDRAEIAAIMSGTAAGDVLLRKNPVYHVSLSWREGEHPSREQCEAVVKRVMDGLDMGQCEAFWALHRDTDNDHIHLVINRVHPDTLKVAGPPRRDYCVLHLLTREMELAQGWSHAAGYYVTVEPVPGRAQIMRRVDAEKRGLWGKDEEWRPAISQGAARAEHNLGAASFQSWVAGEPAQALQEALALPEASWATAHAALARYGLTIEPKGSGMIVLSTFENDAGASGPVVAKASQLGKWASKAALEKRLGPFVAPSVQQSPPTVVQTYTQAVRAQRLAEWMPKHTSPDPVRAARREERAAARANLIQRFESEQNELRAQRKANAAQLRDVHLQERKALRSELNVQRRALKALPPAQRAVHEALHAKEAAARLEALQLAQAEQRKALYAGIATTRQTRPAVWRAWVEAQARAGDPAAQAALRGIHYQEKKRRRVPDNAIEGEDMEPLRPLTVQSLHAEVDRSRQQITYKDSEGGTRFVDTGPRLVMRDDKAETLEAALRIAAQKYGGQVMISGSAEFRQQAARLATRLNIRVADADLQAVVAGERAHWSRGPQR